jgi:hypothetical protein
MRLKYNKNLSYVQAEYYYPLTMIEEENKNGWFHFAAPVSKFNSATDLAIDRYGQV